jgi:putative transposase
MTSLPDRQQFVTWFDEAVAVGASRTAASAEMNLPLRTLQRWTQTGALHADARTTTVRPTSANALSPQERAAILALCNSPEHAHLPPSQIVPRLADQGRYVASESTFYRVLRAADQQHRRGRSQPPQRRAPPTTHVATAARQVWSWDISVPQQAA